MPDTASDSTTSQTPPAMTANTGGATIQLLGVTKNYPGQAAPAVDHITMEIAAGEIVVLVGACGEPADVARVGMGAAPAMSTNAVSCALLRIIGLSLARNPVDFVHVIVQETRRDPRNTALRHVHEHLRSA